MPHETEAACLLRTGALYPRRLGLRPADAEADPIFCGFKPGGFSIYRGDQPYFHLDLEGRWQRALVRGTHFLKALDASVQAIDRVREGRNLVLRRRSLGFAEAADLDALVRETALELLAGLGSGRLEPLDPPAPAEPIALHDLSELLERIARWDAAAWFAQRERLLGTYGPPPFVPPDAAGAPLLQATLGHARGYAFGNAPAVAFYERSLAEFEEHARTVSSLWGRRLAQAKILYLAGAELWRRPAAGIAPYLDLAAQLVRRDDGQPLPLTGFLDDFASPGPVPDGWAALARAGLGRMTLGIESGDPEILRRYNKTWTDRDLDGLIRGLNAAEVVVSLVVLVGSGGAEDGERHLSATATLVESLPLRGGVVYLIDADEVGGPQPREPLAASGRSRLHGAELEGQRARFRERLAPVLKPRGVKVVPYSMEKQGV